LIVPSNLKAFKLEAKMQQLCDCSSNNWQPTAYKISTNHTLHIFAS
jgi:hypothetical protein